MAIECEMEVFGNCGPFDDELITGRFDEAIERIRGMDSVQAVQLILATYCRSDSVIERRELDDLAEFMGVFTDDDDPLDREPIAEGDHRYYEPSTRQCRDCGGSGVVGETDDSTEDSIECRSCGGRGVVPQ